MNEDFRVKLQSTIHSSGHRLGGKDTTGEHRDTAKYPLKLYRLFYDFDNNR